MEKIIQYLQTAGTFYLATVDGDAPQIRPFGAVDRFEGKLYIQTGAVKPCYKQMMANPKVAICVMGKDGTWLRISATAVRDDRVEARQHMLDANPGLKRMYAADDGNCEVLYLKDVTASICSFTAPPEVHTF